MRKLHTFKSPIGNCAATTAFALSLFGLFLFAGPAYAQFGAAASQSQQGAQATPLPLSGRGGASGGVVATQTAIPGTTTSVNTLNPTVQVSGAFAGSASSTAARPFSGKLSLQEAVDRAIEYNLGAVGMNQALRQAHGQTRVARSALLPNLNGDFSETVETVNLAALGVRFNVPTVPGGSAFSIPTLVGPFNYMDLRARLTQSVADFTARNNYRAAQESLRAAQLSAQDARDLVVLATGGAYLQVIAAKARVQSAQAQLETANAVYQQTRMQLQFGKAPEIDVNRSQVEVLTQQQRLVSLQNDVAKQKINLARLTGLPPNDQYDISDEVPFAAAPPLTIEDAVKQAFDQRADLKAAEVQVSAAERALTAARDERYPSLSVSADYGAIGTNPGQARGTFTAVATLTVPIWRGGRAEGDIEEADAVLRQRQAELEDQKSQVESDVRNAYLDLQAAASQVQVAVQNLDVTRQTLAQERQRFEAGVSNDVAVTQAQESVASAELDYINSVFAHNLAKLSLARAVGNAPQSLRQFLKFP
jgi:outer membrane protein TolC